MPAPPNPPPTPPPPPPVPLDPLAALLSYLIPGLGQVIQGRVSKGLLFFVCLNSLFFYGFWLGQAKNVWLPEASGLPGVRLPLIGEAGGAVKAVYHRPQFLAQFWMGLVAWPAIVQFATTEIDPETNTPLPTAWLGRYMQAPSEMEINTQQRSSDKRFDLGWVYTVIAGVLNILVIYDALAGPVIREGAANPAQPTTASPGSSAGPAAMSAPPGHTPPSDAAAATPPSPTPRGPSS